MKTFGVTGCPVGFTEVRRKTARFCFRLILTPEYYSVASVKCHEATRQSAYNGSLTSALVRLDSFDKLYAFEYFLKSEFLVPLFVYRFTSRSRMFQRWVSSLTLLYISEYQNHLWYSNKSLHSTGQYFVQIIFFYVKKSNLQTFYVLDLNAPEDVWIQGIKGDDGVWRYEDGTRMSEVCPMDNTNGLDEFHTRFRTYQLKCSDRVVSPLGYACEANL